MMRWNSTKTYTEDDIMRMQQEAVNRVHEFQTRARETATYYDTPTYGELRPVPPPMPAVIEAESRVLPAPDPAVPPPPPPVQSEPASTAPADSIQGLLDRFNLDGDMLLILGLIFLLYNEKADNTLLLALGYLLL